MEVILKIQIYFADIICTVTYFSYFVVKNVYKHECNSLGFETFTYILDSARSNECIDFDVCTSVRMCFMSVINHYIEKV